MAEWCHNDIAGHAGGWAATEMLSYVGAHKGSPCHKWTVESALEGCERKTPATAPVLLLLLWEELIW